MRAQGQYVVVNIAPGEEHQIVFEQIQQVAKRKSSDRVALGIGAIFSYLNQSREQCRNDLIEFLSLAERYETPIVVQLDGEQWSGASRLVELVDPERPGYDPETGRTSSGQDGVPNTQ